MAQRNVTPCRLCGETKPLIKAHIFPQALAKEVGTAEDPGRTYSLGATEPPRRLRTGWYDPEILCRKCDGETLGPLDAYGVTFLRSVEQYRVQGPTRDWARIAVRPGADPLRLKLFALAVLWRAAISRRPEFEGIWLGPFESKLRRRILDGSPETVDEFGTMVTWCQDDSGDLISPPRRFRFRGGVSGYLMHVARHTILIKVDSRPAPARVEPLLLDPKRELTVLVDTLVGGPIGRQAHALLEADERRAWRAGPRARRSQR